MRRNILHRGSTELSYEIREIVEVAHQFEALGVNIYWENIGDPIQKGARLPVWFKKIVSDLTQKSASYAYSPTKGVLTTRQYLAQKTNARGGAQITENDILFCNGLGDAISKVYEYLDAGARVIGPSPAYSTHSSAEGSHASQPPLTYNLNPDNKWYPDLVDLRNKVHYNPNIVGILIINPDNPTGMVYPEKYLREFVKIAREYNLFLLADEIYTNITFNGVKAVQLCEIIEDVPGIAMKGISKEFPWPGSRCGWMEFYNSRKDEEFNLLVKALNSSKMLEVCSTTLPQMAIPAIMGHPSYKAYRQKLNEEIEERGNIAYDLLRKVNGLVVNRTLGAFYMTVLFKEGALKPNLCLKLKNPDIQNLVDKLVAGQKLDKRFVYYLLASRGICVVPISSFCSGYMGFRITLLEVDKKRMQWIFKNLRDAITEYLTSA